MYHTTEPFALYRLEEGERLASAADKRLARSLALGRSPRTARFGLTTIVSMLAFLGILTIADVGAVAESPTSSPCEFSDGSYVPGCRMLQGHADGWFQG